MEKTGEKRDRAAGICEGPAGGSGASFERIQLCCSSSSLFLSAHACPLLCPLFLSFLLQAAPNCPSLVSPQALHACASSRCDAVAGAGTALPHSLPLAPTSLSPSSVSPLRVLPEGPQLPLPVASIPHGVMAPLIPHFWGEVSLLGVAQPTLGLASPLWWQTGWFRRGGQCPVSPAPNSIRCLGRRRLAGALLAPLEPQGDGGTTVPQWRAARRVRAGGASPGGLLAVGANPCFPSGGRMPPPCMGTSLF